MSCILFTRTIKLGNWYNSMLFLNHLPRIYLSILKYSESYYFYALTILVHIHFLNT